MKARFDELLPFYVNGTLPADERAEVEAWLREHPKAEAELRWYESLTAKLKEDVPAVSSDPADAGICERCQDALAETVNG